MPKERTVVSKVLNLVVFILLEAAALLLLSNNSELQRLWVVRLSHGFMAKTWGASQSIGAYFSLKSQNDELSLENQRLWERVRAFEAASARTDSSAGIYGGKSDGFSFIPATIIKSSTNTQHNFLIIDKGFEDGVEEGSGVITSKGVVGIVDAVSRHYSYAISFLNESVNISARLGKEGAVGPLAWDGVSTDGALLREIPLQFKFAPGDTVYTSGYSTMFPPDIPLGVTGEARLINGATNEVKVKLFQEQNALKYITIVCNERAKEIQDIENQSDGPVL